MFLIILIKIHRVKLQKDPPCPPFLKGDLGGFQDKTSPPFLKGDLGGFLIKKDRINGIFSE
ncbi:hypothetical protein GMMP1_470015 [Candidatus Magnetomoraceae bacterium gMMP-1]